MAQSELVRIRAKEVGRISGFFLRYCTIQLTKFFGDGKTKTFLRPEEESWENNW